LELEKYVISETKNWEIVLPVCFVAIGVIVN
jgi:hypothetical protein